MGRDLWPRTFTPFKTDASVDFHQASTLRTVKILRDLLPPLLERLLTLPAALRPTLTLQLLRPPLPQQLRDQFPHPPTRLRRRRRQQDQRRLFRSRSAVRSAAAADRMDLPVVMFGSRWALAGVVVVGLAHRVRRCIINSSSSSSRKVVLRLLQPEPPPPPPLPRLERRRLHRLFRSRTRPPPPPPPRPRRTRPTSRRRRE